MGLLQRPLRFDRDTEALTIRSAIPGQAVLVRGRLIPPQRYYRLDAALGPGQSLRWPFSLLAERGYRASELALRERDRLDLGRVEGHYLRVDYEPKTRRFHIRFEGRVEQVMTGPDGFEHNRAPTLLEYLYKQKQLTLLWGAVVFLWGLFWGVRGWMRAR